MYRVLFIFLVLFMCQSVMSEEWTTTVQQPIPYGQYGAYPNYQYGNPYYNQTIVSPGCYPNSTYNVNNPYQYQYNNPYNYYNSSVYPGGLNTLGSTGVQNQIIRNVGRNLLYSFMRGY